MRALRHLIPIITLLMCGHNSLWAQQLVLPQIDFAAYESAAIEAVKKLPRKGKYKRKESYNHLYFFAASKREGVTWANIKNQADFIRALDFQTPVQFEGYQAPTNIYADYIYDSKGNMRWIYADGKASRVNRKEGGNSPQNTLIEIARKGFQLVFVVEGTPKGLFFGIKDGVVYATRHVIWEAYDTNPIDTCVKMKILERLLTGNMEAKFMYHETHNEQAAATGISKAPSFLGGDIQTFGSWLNDEIQRVGAANPNTISSTRTLLEFIIGKDGSIEDIVVKDTDNMDMANLVIQILQNAPKWTPTLNNDGEPMKIRLQLPVDIQLKLAH